MPLHVAGNTSGFVASSRALRKEYACSDVVPHISLDGFKFIHTDGLSGFPNNLHLLSGVNWIHLTPAGFPSGIPGIGDDIDITTQQAAHPILHSIKLPPQNIKKVTPKY